MGSNDVKPWRWVGHLLGHEGPGSLAAALKAQGLITALEAGVGDEVRDERDVPAPPSRALTTAAAKPLSSSSSALSWLPRRCAWSPAASCGGA